MAMDATALENRTVFWPDEKWVVKVLQRERVGMPEPIFGFGEILADEIVGSVAIVAGGDGVVAGFLPAVVVIAHDVAVDARCRIAAEVRKAFAVIVGVAAGAQRDPYAHAENERKYADAAKIATSTSHRDSPRSSANEEGKTSGHLTAGRASLPAARNLHSPSHGNEIRLNGIRTQRRFTIVSEELETSPSPDPPALPKTQAEFFARAAEK